MIGRAWRSGRRMRLFCGVCAALRLSQAFGFGLAKRVRGERECLSLSFSIMEAPHGWRMRLLLLLLPPPPCRIQCLPLALFYNYIVTLAVLSWSQTRTLSMLSFLSPSSTWRMTSSTYSLPPLPRLPFFSLFRRCANADETHWPVTAKAPSSQTRLGRVYNHVFSSKNDENLLCFRALSSVSEGSDNEGHGSHQIRPNRCFIDREREGGWFWSNCLILLMQTISAKWTATPTTK